MHFNDVIILHSETTGSCIWINFIPVKAENQVLQLKLDFISKRLEQPLKFIILNEYTIGM